MIRRLPLILALTTVAAPALAIPSCPTDEHRAELSSFEKRLLGADDVDDARHMALSKVDKSRKAIDRAAYLVPGDRELIAHQEALDAFAGDIEHAQTKEEVAKGFSDLRAKHAGSSCYYSTGEIIATVLGFVLGILPGIILLILLC
ncbi:MAG: hypothetical protein EP330_00620 [Deltaproteobacteria bacterium]|nr:MAG: hypothetical protein EP330_00620 [Deltaproteobacteria bacterium]